MSWGKIASLDKAKHVKEKWDNNCKSCQAVQGLISLVATPRILETKHWVVEHGHPTALKGWLVVVLKRHCRAIHDLTAEETLEFGRLLPIICQALHEVLKTESEYVVQFAEGEGFHHVHFHMIARMPQWPESLRGRRVFDWMGEKVDNPLSGEDLTPLALEIREYMLEHLPADLLVGLNE